MAKETETPILNLKDLLDDDINNIKRNPEAVVKLDVLSEELGRDVYVKVRGMKNREYLKYGSTKQGDSVLDNFDNNLMVVLNGVVEPDLHDKDTRDRFGARTPMELVEMLFQGSDIGKATAKIQQLSGISDEDGNPRDVEGETKN